MPAIYNPRRLIYMRYSKYMEKAIGNYCEERRILFDQKRNAPEFGAKSRPCQADRFLVSFLDSPSENRQIRDFVMIKIPRRLRVNYDSTKVKLRESLCNISLKTHVMCRNFKAYQKMK